MGEDASLDDFLTTGESEESDDESSESDASGETEPDAATAEAEPADTSAEAVPDESDEMAPATTTYAWDGAGAACEDCGETVERRWQQGGDLVCVACKDWERG